MNQIRKRLTYANVMSTIAVFLVVGGASAFAASQLGKNTVGAKQLKKDSVTAVKIKQGAVTQDKIAAAAQSALKGDKGPVGPAGPAGPTGPQGARGPSAGFSASVDGNVEVGASAAAKKVIVSLALPAGKWLITGETGLTNVSGASRSAWCSLDSGTTQLGLTRALDEALKEQRSGDATVLGAANLPSGGTVNFNCWASGSSVFTPSQSKPAIQAVQVESLN